MESPKRIINEMESKKDNDKATRKELPEISDENDAYVESGPLGLQSLCVACSSLYPDQQNPLQVTARVKYWLGGPDPLDYISMYWNSGKPELNIPPHWHYISFGLSDLHGDGRVHPPVDNVILSMYTELNERVGIQSGYGIELTFRLKSEAGRPPEIWPATLLQNLARYIFKTGNKLCVGDHISWHCALDNSSSKIQHMLVADEPQLKTTYTPFGYVQFLQIVGVTQREMRSAQRGTGVGVLKAMTDDPNCGGPWLVTDMSRSKSCKELDVNLKEQPSDLAGVSTQIRYTTWYQDVIKETPEPKSLPTSVKEEIKCILQKGLTELSSVTGHSDAVTTETKSTSMSVDQKLQDSIGVDHGTAMSTDSFKMSSMEQALFEVVKCTDSHTDLSNFTKTGKSMDDISCTESGPDPAELVVMKAIHIIFNAEGGYLLPLALRGRILHQRHFTWRGARSVTFLSRNITGALATKDRPYVATPHGWLQVYIPDELAQDMAEKTSILEHEQLDQESDNEGTENKKEHSAPSLPATFEWPKYGLKITILEHLEDY